MKMNKKTVTMTASSFAIAEPTSYIIRIYRKLSGEHATGTGSYLQGSGESFSFSIDSSNSFTHLTLCNITVPIFVEKSERCLLLYLGIRSCSITRVKNSQRRQSI